MKQVALLICCLLCWASLAPAAGLEWHGSLKTLDLYGEEAPADLFPDYRLSSNRARLGMDWQPADGWHMETAVDYQYQWSDPREAFPLPDADFNRRLGMEKSWHHGESGASLLQVDRLNLQWSYRALDVTLGRQAAGFGRILIFSPLDVIAPFAPDAIDTEVRRGVDALRATFNYGLDGQLGAIAVWGKEKKYNSTLATWTDNRQGVDLLLIGGQLRGRGLIGAGLAGSLGTLGLKGEFAVHRGRDVDEPGGDRYDSFTLAAVEAWYRFDNGITLITQYLYNGPGSNDPEDYPAVLASAPLREGLTYLLGRHYLILAPSYEVHPLVTVNGLLICNLGDHSLLLRPTFDINLADNLSLQLFWSWNLGEKPSIVSSGFPPVETRSEFGLRGDNGGLLLSWFF